MSTVAAGLIAVATGPIAYTETDADGKPVADTLFFAKGDIIHDEALVQTLHGKHFHHALSVTAHSEHLCPDDCVKTVGDKAQIVAPPTRVLTTVPPLGSASSATTADSEVK